MTPAELVALDIEQAIRENGRQYRETLARMESANRIGETVARRFTLADYQTLSPEEIRAGAGEITPRA